jgi:hypothetical protein
MVRLMRARPRTVSSAFWTVALSASFRMPTAFAFGTGTRSVILSLAKATT